MPQKVLIVGAGLTGLACALRLKERGIEATLLEASDRVGGRVATDSHEGFLLDRGFQVLLTAYPESSRLFDYPALSLASFHSGSKVFTRGELQTVGDPRRHLADALPTLLASVGTLADKARILRLAARVTGPSLDRLFSHPESTTLNYLRRDGFSSAMIDSFFRPFLGGIFLESELATSSRKFEFVFRMFSQGTAALPKNGMSELPYQLAARLAPTQVRLHKEVIAVGNGDVHLSDGSHLEASTVVLATDPWTRRKLLNQQPGDDFNPVACLYFAAQRPPLPGPWLVLNGEADGPVNNLCSPSEVHSSYAPAGQSLISITVLKRQYVSRPDLKELVLQQVTRWFGAQVNSWSHLRTYHIHHSVPLQAPPALQQVDKPVKLNDRLYACGDDGWVASIEGAVHSGLKAADQIPLA